jgi:SAM-dependent methyltransferase
MVVPATWLTSDWEAKARENPLYAVMTTPELRGAAPTDFTPQQMEMFFQRGDELFTRHILPRIADIDTGAVEPLLVEYGCGMGRILRAATRAGYRCAGIDISETMLEHCRRLVPQVESLHLAAPNGGNSLPDASADLVFSYAVLQHIDLLSHYIGALDEMTRVLKPGGVLAIQVNCEDFNDGDFARSERTENFETFSRHYKPLKRRPYLKKQNNKWSGVYIGYERLCDHLHGRGVVVTSRYYHNPAKFRALWVIGMKQS